jgi:hypothetical protein
MREDGGTFCKCPPTPFFANEDWRSKIRTRRQVEEFVLTARVGDQNGHILKAVVAYFGRSALAVDHSAQCRWPARPRRRALGIWLHHRVRPLGLLDPCSVGPTPLLQPQQKARASVPSSRSATKPIVKAPRTRRRARMRSYVSVDRIVVDLRGIGPTGVDAAAVACERLLGAQQAHGKWARFVAWARLVNRAIPMLGSQSRPQRLGA